MQSSGTNTWRVAVKGQPYFALGSRVFRSKISNPVSAQVLPSGFKATHHVIPSSATECGITFALVDEPTLLIPLNLVL